MYDADREGEVETILEHQVIGARPHYLQYRKRAQIATPSFERPLVDIGRDTSGSTQDWQGFLDLGCGMGRNSYWPLKCCSSCSGNISA